MLESGKGLNPWGPVQSLRTSEGVVRVRSADVWRFPGGAQTKGWPPRAGGPRTKPEVVAPAAPRVGLHRAPDHHGPERFSLCLIPTSMKTSMKTARFGRQQALCLGPSRDSCSQSPLPSLCLVPSAPVTLLTSAVPWLSPPAPGRTKLGDTPALGGWGEREELTPGFARRWRVREGCGVHPSLRDARDKSPQAETLVGMDSWV
jgi:hypothetical protein